MLETVQPLSPCVIAYCKEFPLQGGSHQNHFIYNQAKCKLISYVDCRMHGVATCFQLQAKLHNYIRLFPIKFGTGLTCWLELADPGAPKKAAKKTLK